MTQNEMDCIYATMIVSMRTRGNNGPRLRWQRLMWLRQVVRAEHDSDVVRYSIQRQFGDITNEGA